MYYFVISIIQYQLLSFIIVYYVSTQFNFSTTICKLKSNDLFATVNSSSTEREDVYNHDHRRGRDTREEGGDGDS